MPRKPQPGGDQGTWGNVLNEFLDVSHEADGSLKSNIVGTAHIQDGGVTEVKLSSAVQTKLNAVGGGGAPADGSITTAKLADSAVTNAKITDGTISEAKLASAVQTKLNTPAVVADGSISTVKLADGAVTDAKVVSIAQAKVTGLSAALGAKADSAHTHAVADVTGLQGTLNAKYEKPVAGIPESDLTSAVQTKLNSVGVTTLDGLTDVNTTGVLDGQALVFQGSQWGPATISGGGGSSDHGALTGLADDDHSQYHNDTRGDIRYYTKAQVDSALTAKANDTAVVHLTGAETVAGIKTFSSSPIVPTPTTTGQAATKGYVDSVAGSGIADGAVTTAKIADSAVTDAKIASVAQAKVTGLGASLAAKADTTHAHAAADITSGTIATVRLGSGTANSTTYLRGDGTWATVAGGGATNLDALTDVVVATPTNGQTLVYNGTNWVNQAPAAGGGNTYTAVARTASYTAVANDFVVCDASAGGFTITLPAPANGAMVRVKKIDNTANAVIVDAPGAILIDNTPSASINIQWQSNDFLSDGTKWFFV